MSPRDPRLDAVAELLNVEGLGNASVRVAGAQADIAVLGDVPIHRLVDLAPRIRDLGFRFVTADLADVAQDTSR